MKSAKQWRWAKHRNAERAATSALHRARGREMNSRMGCAAPGAVGVRRAARSSRGKSSTRAARVSPLLLPPLGAVYHEFLALLASREVLARPRSDTVRIAGRLLDRGRAQAQSIGYVVSRSGYTIKVFDPLLAGMYAIPGDTVVSLICSLFGHRAAFKNRHGRDDRFLSCRAQHHRRPALRRSHLL